MNRQFELEQRRRQETQDVPFGLDTLFRTAHERLKEETGESVSNERVSAVIKRVQVEGDQLGNKVRCSVTEIQAENQMPILAFEWKTTHEPGPHSLSLTQDAHQNIIMVPVAPSYRYSTRMITMLTDVLTNGHMIPEEVYQSKE